MHRKEMIFIMKKIIALLAVVALVVCCFAMTVNAANESPETSGPVKVVSARYPSGTNANLKLVKKPSSTSSDFKPQGNDVIIGQYTVENGSAAKDEPVTITANIAGVKTSSEVTVLAKKADGTIDTIKATVTADGVVEVVLNDVYAELAFVVDKQTASAIGVSDKTGDVTTPIVMVVLLFSVLGMTVSYRKVRA